jgi:hypothetical protein
MAKIAKKLTDTEIKSTKPAEKEVNLFDGDGLILRIAPLEGGKKNWYFRYAVPVTKKRTKMSLEPILTLHLRKHEPYEMNISPCLQMVLIPKSITTIRRMH